MQEINTKKINYRGKSLTALINIKEAYKDKDKLLSAYVSSVINDIMVGWKKEEPEMQLTPPTKK